MKPIKVSKDEWTEYVKNTFIKGQYMKPSKLIKLWGFKWAIDE